MRRFLSGGDVPGASGGFGPLFSLQGHVALLPLVRVGAYLSHDSAPTNGPEPAKQITSAGLRVKFTPPWPRGEWRAWAFLGFGYAGVYAPSYHPKLQSPGAGSPEEVYAPGSGGAFLEIPLGIGVGYMIRKPWQVTAELGTRLGAAFGGSLYRARPAYTPSGLPVDLAPLGNDSAAVFLTIGVSLDL